MNGVLKSEIIADPLRGTQDEFYSRGDDCVRPTIVKGKGVYLFDDSGRKYIDVSSGPVVSNIGHGNERVIDAMSVQARELDFAYPPVTRNIPNAEFSKMLCDLAGPNFERAMFVSGGSEAIDMAIKFCRQHRYATGETQRVKIISCQPSYHGQTIGTLAVSGDTAFSEIFGDMVTFSEKIPAPLSYRADPQLSEEELAEKYARYLEEKIISIGADEVLAFIVEPVGGSSSGANAPSEHYFNRVREICTRHRVFLIYDEVMSGIGRTGKFLASHYFPKAQPDVSVVSKGLGAGYTPLGAMLTSAELVEELAQLTGFNYGHTYNANPISCAVGKAILTEITECKLIENCYEQGVYIREKLMEMAAESLIIGDIRGRGLLLAIEIVADKKTQKSLPIEINAPDSLRRIGMENGLLLYSRRSNGGVYGDNILISPPMNITKLEVDDILLKLKQTIFQYQGELEGFNFL